MPKSKASSTTPKATPKTTAKTRKSKTPNRQTQTREAAGRKGKTTTDGQIPVFAGQNEICLKDGKVVGWQWSRDVHVPLRPRDYTTPIIARMYPFQGDSPEEVLPLAGAGALLLYVPFCARFKRWPIREVNGVRGYQAGPGAYAEMRRLLLEYRYSESDFEQATLPQIIELLGEGTCRRDSAEWAREHGRTPAGGKTREDGSGTYRAARCTLADFIKEFCQGEYTENRIGSFVASIRGAAKRGKIELPQAVWAGEGAYRRGQKKYYAPAEMIATWPAYQEHCPNLPPLKVDRAA